MTSYSITTDKAYLYSIYNRHNSTPIVYTYYIQLLCEADKMVWAAPWLQKNPPATLNIHHLINKILQNFSNLDPTIKCLENDNLDDMTDIMNSPVPKLDAMCRFIKICKAKVQPYYRVWFSLDRTLNPAWGYHHYDTLDEAIDTCIQMDSSVIGIKLVNWKKKPVGSVYGKVFDDSMTRLADQMAGEYDSDDSDDDDTW